MPSDRWVALSTEGGVTGHYWNTSPDSLGDSKGGGSSLESIPLCSLMTDDLIMTTTPQRALEAGKHGGHLLRTRFRSNKRGVRA